MRVLSFALSERIDEQSQPRWSFQQPCTRYEHGICSIYEQRPRVCASYRCRLLDGYIAGTRSFESCIEVIRLVRELTAQTREDQANAANTSLSPEATMRLASLDVLQRKLFKSLGVQEPTD